MFSSNKAEKLEKLAGKGKVDKIAPYIKDKDPALRAAAAKALGKVDSDDSYNVLISALHDRELNVRMSVVSALVALKRPSAAEHLRHAYGSTSEPEFVEACKKALSTFMDLKKGV